ncbi:MAG TPA: hypothetical protein VGN00_18415 [Puia sp.]
MERFINQELAGQAMGWIGYPQFGKGRILIAIAGRKGCDRVGYLYDATTTAAHAFAFTKVVIIDLIEK